MACSMWYDGNAERARIPATCTVQGQQVEAGGGEFKKKKTVNDEWPHSSLSALMLELLYQFTLFHKKGLAVSVLS